jgi:hypothetical protein
MPKISVTGGASQAGAPAQQGEPVLLRGARIVVYDGSVGFAAAGSGPDVTVGRAGAGTLRVIGALTVDGAVTQGGTFTASGDVNVTGTLTAFGFFGAGGNVQLGSGPSLIGFFGASPAGKPEVTGARDDGTALASLLTQLATLGLITDSTTAT